MTQFYRIPQAAARLGLKEPTLRKTVQRMVKAGHPFDAVKTEKRTHYIFTDNDIARIADYRSRHGGGWPKGRKWAADDPRRTRKEQEK